VGGGSSFSATVVGFRCAVVPILHSYAVLRGGTFDAGDSFGPLGIGWGIVSSNLSRQPSQTSNLMSFRCAVVPTNSVGSYAVRRGAESGLLATGLDRSSEYVVHWAGFRCIFIP